MNIYHYNPTTGECLGMGEAQPNPLEPDKWLVPAHATLKEPPTVGSKQAAVWRGEDWEIVTDLRGIKYWDKTGSPHKIDTLDVVVPNNATTTPPPSFYHEWNGEVWIENTERKTMARASEIRAQRDKLLEELRPRIERSNDQKELIEAGVLGAPFEPRAPLLLYRQVLRDIPQTKGFPWLDKEIPWPVDPLKSA